MRVQADNINFNAKLRTASVLETTTGCIFENTDDVRMKKVFLAFNDKQMKAPGNKGYRYYAKAIGEKKMLKFPKENAATEDFTAMLE